MFKIQTLNKIASIGLAEFPTDRYEVGTNLQNPDAILVRSHKMHDYPMSTTLKVIGRAGAGINNIPIELLSKKGIPVFNTPGANANAVRELVLAGMFLASRHICEAWDFVKHLTAENDVFLNQSIEEEKKKFIGTELYGKTLGVIGLGSIGVKVANAAQHLGMKVKGYDPKIAVKHAWELSALVEQAHSIEEMLMNADFVSCHIPLNAETKHLINAERLAFAKPTLVLLNFSRDGIIDNTALLSALNAKKVAIYVNDFPSLLLKNHPQVISLPHLGASTKEAEENCARMIAIQVRNYLEYGAIQYSANFPTVDITPNYHHVRLAIVNENIPNMVAQISARLAAEGINIGELVNKSRDLIAYTLIDLEQDISSDLIKKMAEIKGIIQIRKLNPLPNTRC